MKRLTITFLWILLIGFSSCQKEKINNPTGPKDQIPEITAIEAPKKGETACTVKDATGEGVCAGTRCGTPVGTCGKKETKCKCVSKYPSSTMSNDEYAAFESQWNSDEGREMLESQGYYSEDEK